MADMRNPRSWPVAAAAILLAAFAAGARSAAPVPDRQLETLEAVSGLGALTETLWPGWDISETPFVLYDPDGTCYLLHHPRPPVSFSRVRGLARINAAMYGGPASSPDVQPGRRQVNGVPTAFLDAARFDADPVATSMSEAFRVFIEGACPGAMTPVELVVDYPVDARHLAMADIECELLARAAAAPEDSLMLLASEFATVRQLRRFTMMPCFAQYERWLEMRDGMPLYIGERARGIVPRPLRGETLPAHAPDSAGSLDLVSNLAARDDPEWYREGRFACTGAGVCVLLDRLGGVWQRDVKERCMDPYEILRGRVPETLPRASDVLTRMHLDERVSRKLAAEDAARTSEERLFESITGDPGPLLSVVTRQLSSVSVSLDRQNIVQVDAHREVHTRVLKAEYSGGTHVYFTGCPVAATLGDTLEYREFVTRLPADLRVTADDQLLELTPGIHSAVHSLLVEGEGIAIQARAAAIVVGESRITLVLQQ
jgi:hypothetical protein